MTEDQKNFAIKTTREGLNTYSSLFECAKYIQSQCGIKYGGEWCVIIKLRYSGESYFTFFDDCYISFSIGQYYVDIGKASLGDKSIRLEDKGDYDKYNIIASEMSQQQKNFAIEKTRNALKMHKDHFQCVNYIKDKFDDEYGGIWCAIILPRG